MDTRIPPIERIAEAIDYLVMHYETQPDLNFLARRAGYESSYFQKLFKSHVGISPKHLIGYMHARHAQDLLKAGHTTLDTVLETGLSSTSRLHDLCISYSGMSPGAIKARAANQEITYGFYPTILGEMIIGKTSRGLCRLGFLIDQSRDLSIRKFRECWPKADFIHNDDAVIEEGRHIMSIWAGKRTGQPLKLDLKGTNFQIQVWQALLRIPPDHTVTYKDIAQHIGKPKAFRAVGNAVGANPVALIIPCHRVIRASGIIDNYAWGSARKKLILGLEDQRV